MNILVTGGAGFIGSFLVDALVERGEHVRIFDNLEEQVHGGRKPSYLNPRAEFIRGDVRDTSALGQALQDMDTVFHFASAVGVGQSQYEIKRYSDVNVGGTANLLDIIVNQKLPIRKMLVPTSMTAYGEGAYACAAHGVIRPDPRPFEQMQMRDWNLRCPSCGEVVQPVATPESAERRAGTIYALTKNMQEQMILSIGRTYGIPSVALRLFNVYGPRQSLGNPYTGVTAIFLARLKNGQKPVCYEDGLQSRDFVSVHDVVAAFLLALENPAADDEVFNIGSGRGTSILEIARTLAKLTGSPAHVSIPGESRKNDIRHCFADASKAKKILGWEPTVSFEEGMRELVEWSAGERAEDAFALAESMLKAKKLQS